MRPAWFQLAFSAACAAAFCPSLKAEPPAPARTSENDLSAAPGLLFARCVKCHGPGRSEAGLRLDSLEYATALLDSGSRAVVPGRPEESEIVARITSDDESLRMPQEAAPLTESEIDLVSEWLAAGAAWPEHWAYRPLQLPKPPQVDQAPPGWPQNPIDQFVLARLQSLGIAPSPEADRKTLARRLWFDLLGLPPSPAAVEAFVNDHEPGAYERLVDRLLASPRFGERWARHWMDLVHFAETHGHDQDRPREHAWPYRDWLIRAFNDDMPYSEFVRKQVAGDALFPDDLEAIAATGFLAAGPWDESSLRDIREDSIDRQIGRYLDRDDIVTTVMSTFASATVHCARCHDHKFDPITQREYYGLQAVFAGTDKANRVFDLDPAVAARRRELAAQRETLAAQRAAGDVALLANDVQAEVAKWEDELGQRSGFWSVLAPQSFHTQEGTTLTPQPDGSLLAGGESPQRDTYTITFRCDLPTITALRLEVLTDSSLPMNGPGRQDNGNLHLNEFVVTAAPADGSGPPAPVALGAPSADFDQEGWTVPMAVDGHPDTAWGIFPEVGKPHHAVFPFKTPIVSACGVTLSVELVQTHGRTHLIGRPRLSATSAPDPAGVTAIPDAITAILTVPRGERADAQRIELAAWIRQLQIDRELAALPEPRLVYCGTSQFEPDGSFAPAPQPRQVHILKRGNIFDPLDEAVVGALSCVSELPGELAPVDLADDGSRRAALADWLADSRNGPTWRSIANRLWQYHFGRGLVDTPNDFGKMGAAPTHPELLDWLASQLVAGGGSLKALHRMMVTSAAYRQESRYDSPAAQLDAENRYLWRMNRRRLDAESIRDAVLSLSGRLDTSMGGPSARQFIESPGIHVTPVVDYAAFSVDDPAGFRRSVYRFIFRTLPDPFMESLDCPDASQLAPKRTESVTALQALSMLNDRFVVRQSELLAERLASESPDLAAQVSRLFELALAREESAAEGELVCQYARLHGLANACRFILNSNEFMFVD